MTLLDKVFLEEQKSEIYASIYDIFTQWPFDF